MPKAILGNAILDYECARMILALKALIFISLP